MTAAVEVTLRLWPVPAACRDARRLVGRFCADHEMEAVADDAVLLTSELVANAVEHAASMVTLLALLLDGSLVVAVRDDCDELPETVMPVLSYAERGRGLHVLDELAGDWGVNRQSHGKTVWFRLP